MPVGYPIPITMSVIDVHSGEWREEGKPVNDLGRKKEIENENDASLEQVAFWHYP